MTPETFNQKSLDAVRAQDSNSTQVAGPEVIGAQGLQATLHLVLYPGETRRSFVLHTASTEPGDNAFEEIALRRGQVGIDGQQILIHDLDPPINGSSLLTLVEAGQV